MVPAAGIAATADQAIADDGDFELFFVDDVNAFNAGVVEKVQVATNNALSGSDIALPATNKTTLDSAQQLAYQARTVKALVPQTVKLDSGVVVDVTNADEFEVKYVKAGSDYKPTSTVVANPIDPGLYCAVVTGISGKYAGATNYVPFQIEPKSLTTAVAYDPSKTTNETTFTYNGNAQTVGFRIPATASATTPTVLAAGKDYSVVYAPYGQDINSAGTSTPPTNAGKYKARLTGLGIYAGQQPVDVDLEIKQLDLSKADVVVDTVIGDLASMPMEPTSINGATNLNNQVELTYYKQDETTAIDTVTGDPGTYYVKATPKPTVPANPNIIGTSAALTFNKVSNKAVFKYNGNAMPTTYSYDTSGDGAPLDRAKIQAFLTDGVTPVGAGGLVLTYQTKQNGEWGAAKTWSDNGDVKNAGTYLITASVDPSKMTADKSYAVGGSAQLVYTVTNGTLNADASIYITYKAKENITSLTTPYTGTAITKADFAVKIIKDGEEINNASPQIILKDSAGKDITSEGITNVGSYTLEITSPNYTLTGTTTLPITITPVDLQTGVVRVTTGNDSATAPTDHVVTKGGVTYIVSPGSSAAGNMNLDDWVALKYNPGDVNNNGKDDDWVTLDSSSFNSALSIVWTSLNPDTGKYVPLTQFGKVASGTVKATVSANSEQLAKNFKFSDGDETTLTLPLVSSAPKFDDVLPGSWYYDVVNEAANAGFVNGYQNIFNPDAQVTRAQVVCFIFNMAAQKPADQVTVDPGYFEDGKRWKSFDDVDEYAYYAAPLAWAKTTGVVNGIAGTNDFDPDGLVTREQFACMLANYASKVGEFKDVDVAEALAAKPDGGQVSDWAKTSVAWAVSNELIGNGGLIAPLQNASRAEAAAIIMNYNDIFNG